MLQFILSLFIISFAAAKVPERYAGLYGEDLRKALRAEYRNHRDIGYTEIRRELYGHCFNAEGRNSVSAFYSNEMLDFEYGSKNLGQNNLLNAEHIIPQSFFGKMAPMVSDGHHIRPCSELSNCARNNFRFAEIAPEKCTEWYKDGQEFTEMPSGDFDSYSCVIKKKAFFPRIEVRGVVARAVAYFFTMYSEYMSQFPRTMDSANLMVKWHEVHTVTQEELGQHDCIVEVQGNKGGNPYILYPELMRIAYCDMISSGCSEYKLQK